VRRQMLKQDARGKVDAAMPHQFELLDFIER
jgi:hypothetical protein